MKNSKDKKWVLKYLVLLFGAILVIFISQPVNLSATEKLGNSVMFISGAYLMAMLYGMIHESEEK